MKFIHLSDLHFTYFNDDERNQSIRARLSYIENKYPDHKLIITGDIVDNGEVNEFAHAKDDLGKFKGRIFICPGNHDFGAGGTEFSQTSADNFNNMLSIPLQQKTFADGKTPVVFPPIIEGPNKVLLIALNTPFRTYSGKDWARGAVGTDQLDSLNTILADPSYIGMVKILFFHHHPFERDDLDPFHRITDEILEMEDSAALMTAIKGKVDVVLFGHKHYSGSWVNRDQIPYILASGNSCKYKTAPEIIIQYSQVTVNELIPIIE